jgi:hypothetical protein
VKFKSFRGSGVRIHHYWHSTTTLYFTPFTLSFTTLWSAVIGMAETHCSDSGFLIAGGFC